MNRSVHFKDKTTIDKVEGNSIPIQTELDSVPKIDAATAVRIGAAYLSETEDEKVDHWGQKLTIERLEVPSNYQSQVLLTLTRANQAVACTTVREMFICEPP
jgi:hypothetical protein